MSLKNLKSKSDEALATMAQSKEPSDRPVRPTTAPGAAAFMQPTIDALNERAKLAEAKAAELMQQLEAQPTELSLEILVEVPGRRRKLTPEQFTELKENLRHNPLTHPISVVRLPHGKFEIVSGHNRADAYRALGRITIRATILDIDAALADRSAFYANLLQTSLTDYEKYAGFRRQREKSGQSQKEMAQSAGVSESILSTLFSFERLPEGAIEIIERKPDAIGMNCVAELAKLGRTGKADRVLEAIELLVEGTLTQKEAMKHAAKIVQAPRAKWNSQPIKIRSGRLDFCEYMTRGSTLRIDFRSESHRAEAEEAIANVLQAIADRLKASS